MALVVRFLSDKLHAPGSFLFIRKTALSLPFYMLPMCGRLARWTTDRAVRVRPLVIVFSVFLGKTLYSDSASLRPGVQMGTGEVLGQPDKMLRC